MTRFGDRAAHGVSGGRTTRGRGPGASEAAECRGTEPARGPDKLAQVTLPESVVEAVRESGDDPHLAGCVTWRKAGTQKVDGYWRTRGP